MKTIEEFKEEIRTIIRLEPWFGMGTKIDKIVNRAKKHLTDKELTELNNWRFKLENAIVELESEGLWI